MTNMSPFLILNLIWKVQALQLSILPPTCASCPELPVWSWQRLPSHSGYTAWLPPCPYFWTSQQALCNGMAGRGQGGLPGQGCGTAGMLAVQYWGTRKGENCLAGLGGTENSVPPAQDWLINSPVLSLCLTTLALLCLPLLVPPLSFSSKLFGSCHSPLEGLSFRGGGYGSFWDMMGRIAGCCISRRGQRVNWRWGFSAD